MRPLSLTVVDPELTAARQADGSFNLGFGGGGGKPLPDVLAEIFHPQANSDLAAWSSSAFAMAIWYFSMKMRSRWDRRPG